MALDALSPWPTGAGLAAARRCLRTALGGSGDNPPDDTLDRLGSTASALVDAYAPSAPQPVKNEAVIRVAGWIKGSRPDEIVLLDAGSVTMQWRHNPGRNAMRNSGAMGLLAAWRSPRATVLQDDS